MGGETRRSVCETPWWHEGIPLQTARRLVTLADFHDLLEGYDIHDYVVRESGCHEVTVALHHEPHPLILAELTHMIDTLTPVLVLVRIKTGWASYWWHRLLNWWKR